jgi:DNA-binding beta-propeller fold protein YncE
MRRLAPTLLVLVVLLACAAPAPAATGDLTFKDCIAKFVSAPCTEVPNQLLEGGFEIAVSPNGNFVYVADGNDSVVGFTRRAADGALAFQGCVDNGDDVGCTHLPKSLLAVVRGLAFSPDGSSLYAVSEASDAVVRFTVGSDGALTFAGCVEDDGLPNWGCATTVSNLDTPEQVAVSPDGGSVYVTVADATESAVYNLSPSLAFRQCFVETPVTGCTQARPLFAARGLAISPNGAQVYVTSVGDDAITWFSRAIDGSLAFAGCLADDDDPGTATDSCSQEAGVNYDFLNSITFNPDGTHAYVTDETGLGVVYHFSRDGTTGALTRQDCLADDLNIDAPGCAELDTTTGSALSSVTDAVVSPDSANLYAAARQDSALSTFGLSSPGGAMTFIRCLRANAVDGCSAFSGSGMFDSPRGVAMSSDGRDVYVANGAGLPAVLHFERDAPGPRTGGVGPGSDPGTGPGSGPGTGPGSGPGTGPGSSPSPVVRCNGLRATIVGTAGSNTIRGTRRRDVIAALGGNDVVRSLGGKDVVCGGDGRDTLDGGPDDDILVGGLGRDVLKGAAGVDRLLGGPGADRLVGGLGGDRLLGGPGRDQLLGGPGRDTSRQ